MQQNSIYGSMLIVGSLLLVVTGAIHPTGAGMFGAPGNLEHVTRVDGIAHGLGIASMWLCVAGLTGFSRLLGTSRPIVTAALSAFVIASVGVVFAATLDGFVVPSLAGRWLDADDTSRAVFLLLGDFCVLVASALTRVYMVLVAIAILLWSLAVRRTGTSRGLPWMGALVTLVAAAAVSRGSLSVSVHEVLGLALVQAMWMVWTGLIMIRADVARSETPP